MTRPASGGLADARRPAAHFCVAMALAAVACALLPIASVNTIVVGGQEAEPPVRVGPTVLVSGSLSRVFHDEVILAAHPADATRLIACSIIDPAPGSTDAWTKTTAYLSSDGGRHWTHGVTSELDTGDPDCGFAPDGSAYLLALAARRPWDRLGTPTLELHRSPDGGRTWSAPRLMAGGDRPWLVIDRTSSVRPTPVYVTYHTAMRMLRPHGRPAPMGLFLQRSTDGGISWTAPAIRLGEVDRAETAGVTPERAVVLADGTVVILYLSPRDFPGPLPSRPALVAKGLAQYVTTSSDEGRSLSDGVHIADYAMLHGPAGAPGGFAALAVDPGSAAFKDRLYAAWGDARTGRSEIYLSYSSDRGASWSPPRVVSDDSPWAPPAVGPDNHMPTLAVNHAGVVGLTWYDRRDSPDNTGFVPRFRASLDGGDTWLPSVRLTDAANGFEQGEAVRLWSFFTRGSAPGAPHRLAFWRHWWVINGHTAGLAADVHGAFHALWVDNRTGINQMYTARVEVAGAAVRHGSADLAAHADVTAFVGVELNGAAYDPAEHAITARMKIRNTSNRTLAGPLIVRTLSVTSELGTATLENADRGTGEGSSWTFDTPAGGLVPAAATAERVLRLRLSPTRRVKEGNDVKLALAMIEVRILSPAR